jgi:hypothetical protein
VSVERQVVGQMMRTGAAVATLLLANPRVSQGQVGLTSGMAQVTLAARIPLRGSIQSLGEGRETGRVGAIREASMKVTLSANTGYRLIVRPSGVPTSRVWVRAATGEFQELTPGSSITVARDAHCAGQWEREVQYRIEMPEGAEALGPLPVRYEISINPTM